MFRLSTKADYGLILLSKLAAHKAHLRGEQTSSKTHLGGVDHSGYVSIGHIANKNQISPKFLSQIAQDLKKAGILTSKEGVSGGYSLAKKPGEIKLLDVLQVLDGELVEGKCFEDGHECVCGAGDMWADMKDQINETLGKKTVADLVISK